jgi:hypothetical protein
MMKRDSLQQFKLISSQQKSVETEKKKLKINIQKSGLPSVPRAGEQHVQGSVKASVPPLNLGAVKSRNNQIVNKGFPTSEVVPLKT